jgi:hypothetical protein
MQVTYENKNWESITIDVATADIKQVSAAYTYLLNQGYTGAFPGSKEWKAAQVFVKQLADLKAARPEVEQYRVDRAAAKSAKRLKGKDILGM